MAPAHAPWPDGAMSGSSPADDVAAWARCGAMALTGDADGPPMAVATNAATVADLLAAPFGLDAAVLGERAAALRVSPRGPTACGRAPPPLPARAPGGARRPGPR